MVLPDRLDCASPASPRGPSIASGRGHGSGTVFLRILQNLLDLVSHFADLGVIRADGPEAIRRGSGNPDVSRFYRETYRHGIGNRGTSNRRHHTNLPRQGARAGCPGRAGQILSECAQIRFPHSAFWGHTSSRGEWQPVSRSQWPGGIPTCVGIGSAGRKACKCCITKVLHLNWLSLEIRGSAGYPRLRATTHRLPAAQPPKWVRLCRKVWTLD